MWKTKPHHPNQRSRGRWRRMEERIGGGTFNCYVLLLMDKTMNTASQAWIRRWTRQSIKQQKRAQWAARLLVSHLKQIVFLVKPDWLLVQLLSVLKYKSFWHFTRFIEHSPNLDKLYVQIHWTFYESGHSKHSQDDLHFRTEGVFSTKLK